jgi:hypothetical protein
MATSGGTATDVRVCASQSGRTQTHTEDTVTASTRLFIIGAVLLLAGLCAGFFPFSSSGMPCGSAFLDPSKGAILNAAIHDVAGLADENCDGDRHQLRLVAIGLLVAGGVVAAGGWVVAGAGKRADPSHSS